MMLLALACAVFGLQAAFTPSLVGSWELVGVADGEVAGSFRLQLAPSGTFECDVAEVADAEPFHVAGTWTVTDDILSLKPQDGARRKLENLELRVAWERGILVLTPSAADAAGTLPLRFARRSPAPR